MVPDLSRFDVVAIDTETTGLRYPVDKAFGVSIATPDGKSYYWDIREDPTVISKLNAEFRGYRGVIAAHNASFDYKMLRSAGVHVPVESLDDTVVRACLLDEHLLDYSLDALSRLCLGDRKQQDIYESLARIYGGRPTRNGQMPNLPLAPSGVVAPYAKKDAELALRLWKWQQEEVVRQDKNGCPSLHKIMAFERSLIPTLIGMELDGVRVDLDRAEQAVEELTPIILAKQHELNSLVGRVFNVNSSPQIRALFGATETDDGWEVNGVPVPATGSGLPSFGSEVLRLLSGDTRARLIIDIRSLIKTRDTFLSGHILGHAVGNRVYPTINQSKGEDGGTGTGRLSIVNPALQQIPSRNKQVAALVKPIFLPDDGQVWVDADESSHEVRIFAHLLAMVGETRIIKQYASDRMTDFHEFVAKLTGLPRNAAYSGQANAKQLNLAKIFCSGNGAIAERMGMPWSWDSFVGQDGNKVRYKKPGPEALAIINKYDSALPGVKKLATQCQSVARDRGFLYTRSGRRIRFPAGSKVYKASGLLIQATAADYNKENILLADKILRNNGGRLLLNIHDSYSMSCPEESLHMMWPEMLAALEDGSRANVPLVLDLSGVGNTWWEALTGNKLIPNR